MDVINFIKEYWVVFAGLVTLIITFIKLFAKVNVMEKLIIPSSLVQVKVEEEVKKQLANHCPFHNDIKDLKEWKRSHTEWGEKTQIATHDSLNEIKINLKMVCTTLGIKYETANGK